MIVSIFFNIVTVVVYIVFWRFLKKSENKRVDEVEARLNTILRLIVLGVVISSIFGLIAIIRE